LKKLLLLKICFILSIVKFSSAYSDVITSEMIERNAVYEKKLIKKANNCQDVVWLNKAMIFPNRDFGDFESGFENKTRRAKFERQQVIILKSCLSKAELGHAEAQWFLGHIYRSGKGVTEDLKAGFNWNLLASEQGYAKAQTTLGRMYEIGKEVTQNDKTALKWYRLAAEQGDTEAQYHLGERYKKGKGVTQNNKVAVKWYRLAGAYLELSRMYQDGKGVPKDIKMEWAYANLITNLSVPTMRHIRYLEKEMTPAQLKEAKRLLEERPEPLPPHRSKK
jgi:TPR repeat protein